MKGVVDHYRGKQAVQGAFRAQAGSCPSHEERGPHILANQDVDEEQDEPKEFSQRRHKVR